MHKGVLTAIVFVVGALGYATHANADLISIGLQETGVNSGAITTETIGSAAATLGAISYGTFRLNQATAQDTAGIGLPALLNSNSLNTSTESAGVLHVWVTAQGLTGLAGLASFVSTFAVNALSSDMSVVARSAPAFTTSASSALETSGI